MERINIEEILEKHDRTWIMGLYTLPSSPLKAAIKEIVEAVVDKCNETANIKTLDTGIGLFEEIDKESILQVKQLIDYGN